MLQGKKIETTWKGPNAQQAKGREVGARGFEGLQFKRRKRNKKGGAAVTRRALLLHMR